MEVQSRRTAQQVGTPTPAGMPAPRRSVQEQMQAGWAGTSDAELERIFREHERAPLLGPGWKIMKSSRAELDRRREQQKRQPVPTPQRDPRINALLKSQRELSRRFRDKMPEFIEGEFGEFSRDRSRALDAERERIAAGMNRRGLLRSGMTEGASADAGQRATQDLRRKRVEIGDRYRGIADDLDNEPLQTQIALAGGQNQIGQAAQNASMAMQKLMIENRMNRQKLLEAAFEGGGSVLGAFLGRGGGNSATDWASGNSDNAFLDFYYGL